MSSFAAQQSLFRAYDIRGAQQYFTAEFVEMLAQALAQLYKAQSSHKLAKISSIHSATDAQYNDHSAYDIGGSSSSVVIGYDVRDGSDSIATKLSNILIQHGLSVINLGLVTTPMMAFWAKEYDGHGIMVTASHSAKDILGIKWLVGNNSPTRADIKSLYQRLLSIATSPSRHTHHTDSKNNDIKINNSPPNTVNASMIHLSTATVATTYIDAIAQTFARIHQHHDKTVSENCLPLSKLTLTIVIDCMNGATSNIAQQLFARFCQNIIMLNNIADGNFPAGNPDPTETNRLVELQQTVIVNDADMGLAFDGDGDRLMVVDNKGKVVTPDHLLYLLAQVAITEQSIIKKSLDKQQVIFDVKCSHHLPSMLSNLGVMPVMSRTGSSLMRQQLQSFDSKAIFAGELSGHFIFNDNYFIVYDDAMYAGLRLLHWLVHTAVSIDIMATLKLAQDPLSKVTASQLINELRINHSLVKNDLCSDIKPSGPPYKLTDISQYLPDTISTADHYLPLPETTTECSIVQQLATFCGYLQHLIESSTATNGSANNTVNSDRSLLCSCFTDKAPITLSQAEELLPLDACLSCIDGVRLDFAHGFGVLRQSNTSHSLTVRFAGDSVADLKDIQARFVALCGPFNKHLAEQIASISHEGHEGHEEPVL